MELPLPPPGSPGMFRCAKPGLIKEILEKAGFKNITEKEVTSKLDSGTIDKYWEMMTEVAAPVVAALSKADDATKSRIKDEVFTKVKQKYPGNVAIEATAMVIAADK